MDPITGVCFIQGDMTKEGTRDNVLEKNKYNKFDLICSDMCPEFKGNKYVDHSNLISLNQLTVDFAFKVLKRNGNLILKTFEGSMQKKFQDNIKSYFNKIHRFKPASSRSESSEIYLVCLGYLENEELKKETEELMKMKPSEYLEQRKMEALKEYKLCKFNRRYLLEDLEEKRKEIIDKYKIDPEKLKIDIKEQEELKKMIDEENDEVRK